MQTAFLAAVKLFETRAEDDEVGQLLDLGVKVGALVNDALLEWVDGGHGISRWPASHQAGGG